MQETKRFVAISIALFVVALVDAVGSLLGYWSVTGSERTGLLLLESAVLAGLLLNSIAITRWVFQQTKNSHYRRVACFSLGSLLLCIGGDIVNFNLPELFYRHGGIVKHDYLADSVWFFSPGYLLLVAAVVQIALRRGVKTLTVVAVLAAALLVSIASFLSMHLAGTGSYVTAFTALHAAVITMVGFSGVLLVIAFDGFKAPLSIWLIAVGLVLASVADALIGNLWIYGNNGMGHFPDIRYVNWFIYIGSQAIVIHLPQIYLNQKAAD